jgi:glycerol-3-phosphate acyltransferase PlsY
MDIKLILAAALGGYLIGSISTGRVVAALFKPGVPLPEKAEVGIEGSDRKMVMTFVSATSISATLGAKYGFMTYVGDVLKVFIPAMALKRLLPGTHYYLVAAAAGMVGHIWPVYHKFRGGRGISAAYGGIFAIDWIGVFISAIGGMLFGIIVLKDLYFIYMAGLWFVIPWLWFRTHDIYIVMYAVIINILFSGSSIPEARQWFKLKREDPNWADWTQAWQISGMGRGIIKMGRRLGMIKKKSG